MTVLLLVQVLAQSSSTPCADYLEGLAQTYMINSTKGAVWVDAAKQQVAGSVLLSGKSIDDLGFPDSCLNYSSSNYLTTEFTQTQPTYSMTVYWGLCINSACDAAQLNSLKRKRRLTQR